MDDPTTRRQPRAPRRGYDVHQTHFFYREDLEAGATVVDHVTGQAVGTVHEVGRHVFEGYGAPAVDGGEPGDLVVEVVEHEAVVPVRMPWREQRAGVRRPGLDPQSDETVTVDLDAPGTEAPGADAVRTDGRADADDQRAPDRGHSAPSGDDPADSDENDDPNDDSRWTFGASMAQGIAVAVLAPLLALLLLIVLLVLLMG